MDFCTVALTFTVHTETVLIVVGASKTGTKTYREVGRNNYFIATICIIFTVQSEVCNTLKSVQMSQNNALFGTEELKLTRQHGGRVVSTHGFP